MTFVKNSRGGREVNMIISLSKINLSKIGWEGGGVNLNLEMSLNILGFFDVTPYEFGKIQCFSFSLIFFPRAKIDCGDFPCFPRPVICLQRCRMCQNYA